MIALRPFPVFSSPLLQESGLVHHGVSGRPIGCPEDCVEANMSFDWGDQTVATHYRSDFAERLGVETSSIVLPRQVHGSDVLVVARRGHDRPFLGQADGLVTAQWDVALGILVADCIPIFLLDRATPAIGLVHAGWRGTVAGIAAKALGVMQDECDTKPENCIVWIGPSIGVCCFEVGPEVIAEFQNAFPRNGIEFGDHIDLKQVNRQILLSKGVPDDQIEISPECSYCSDGFFSHRRAVHRGLERTGRMMGLLALRR